MREYEVTRNGGVFKVYVNDDLARHMTKLDMEGVEKPNRDKGKRLAEVVIGYSTCGITYKGRERGTGRHVLDCGDGGRIYADGKTRLTAELCRELLSEHLGMDLWRVETANGRVFYEACNDMREKKGLYGELGAKVALEHHGKTKQPLKRESQ